MQKDPVFLARKCKSCVESAYSDSCIWPSRLSDPALARPAFRSVIPSGWLLGRFCGCGGSECPIHLSDSRAAVGQRGTMQKHHEQTPWSAHASSLFISLEGTMRWLLVKKRKSHRIDGICFCLHVCKLIRLHVMYYNSSQMYMMSTPDINIVRLRCQGKQSRIQCENCNTTSTTFGLIHDSNIHKAIQMCAIPFLIPTTFLLKSIVRWCGHPSCTTAHYYIR